MFLGIRGTDSENPLRGAMDKTNRNAKTFIMK
jgi:hypothetical protein